MDPSTQRVRDGLIHLGYCAASVDSEIIPWLTRRRIIETGGWTTRLQIYKNYLGFTHPTKTPDEFISALVAHIDDVVQTRLVLKITSFPIEKAS